MSATTTVEPGKAFTKTMAGSRVGALAGLAFALCFFTGTATLEIPQRATDQELVAWWSDSGNQTTAVASSVPLG